MSASDVAALVKQAVDIVEVVGRVTPLRRMGRRHVGLCPFHQEKSPSFHVDSENGMYHCFGCGAGGDVISFVMRHQNLPFGDAVRYLADLGHIVLPDEGRFRGEFSGADDVSRKEREELYSVLRAAGDYFYDLFRHSAPGRVAREYANGRGLSDELADAERLGYAPGDWDGLSRRLTAQGFDTEIGLTAGLLAKSSKESGRIYDRFRNRLIFPIRDDRGRIIAFGGRILVSGTDEPKYLNSPETPVYHKGRTLYQAARAREACRQVRQVLLVEGYMDLLAFHALGFHRVTATLGTALTAHQVRLLGRMADEVVLAYDADAAGEKAMLRSLPLFLQEELMVSCIRFPEGLDPDDFLKRDGLDGLDALIRNRRDLGVFAVDKILEGWDGSLAGKSAVLAELKPVFDLVRRPLQRAEYVRLVADRLSVSEEVVFGQLRHGKKTAERYEPGGSSRPRWGTRKPPGSDETAVSVEEGILRLMIHFPEYIERVKESGAVEQFREPKLKILAKALIESFPFPETGFDRSAVYGRLPDEESGGLFSRLCLEPCEFSEPGIQLDEWLGSLERHMEKMKLPKLKAALREAEASGDTARFREILGQIRDMGSSGKK